MSAKDATTLVIGGEPRIDFLPPEVKERKQARRTRRSLLALVAVVMVACVGGYVFATSLAVQSQLALINEQAKTAALVSEQAQYAEARTIAGQLADTRNARLVASSNEILWSEYLTELGATLPAGMAITALNFDAQSAAEPAPVVSIPLETERVATVHLTATAPTLSTVAEWLDSLREIRGFADLWATPATLDDGLYEVEVRLNVNSTALEKRFFKGYGEAAASPDDADAPPTTDNSETPESDETTTEDEG